MNTCQVVSPAPTPHLREQAPAQAHRLATTDDERTTALATAHGLQVTADDDGLAIRGDQPQLDALITDIVGAGIGPRRLALSQTPLEAPVFMLTQTAPDPHTAAP